MTVPTEAAFEIDETEARAGIFAGDDPFMIFRDWLAEARESEPNDPEAMALATADAAGLPNLRMVLMKQVEDPAPAARGDDAGGGGAFLFFTNYGSAKGEELTANPQAALLFHWKSLRRQVRARGVVERVDDARADAYYDSRGLASRLGAWASKQSRPLSSRAALMAEVAGVAARHPLHPPRPPFWGGFRIRPVEMEFWADGAHRLHDRFRWRREAPDARRWTVTRLNP